VGSKCWSDIDRHYKGQILAKVWFGPGYLCYVVCLLAAFMRAIFHWLTPIPGGGSGCTPQLPQALIDLLDEDGDGVVTWAEVAISSVNARAAFSRKSCNHRLG